MDAETKKLIASVCEMLRELVKHQAATEHQLEAVLMTLAEKDSSFHSRWKAHTDLIERASNRDVAVNAEQTLLQLGRIIQKLKE